MDETSNIILQEKIKILFDTTFLFDQYSKRGIGVYGRNVISRMVKKIAEENLKFEIHFIGFSTLGENLIELGYSQFTSEELSEKINFHSLGEEKPSSLQNLKDWNKLYKPVLEEIKPDIFYAIHFERGLPSVPELARSLSFKTKTVVIAHDAIPLVTNKFSSKGFIANLIKKKFFMTMWEGVKNADIVITPSNFSKQDIIKYGHVDEKKIKTIYLGVDEKFRRENYLQNKEIEEHTLEIYSLLNKNYFIYDSGLEANKGADHLAKIFKEILNTGSQKVPNYLVMIGKDFYKGEGLSIKPKSIMGDDFIKLAKKIGIAQNLITTDKISEEHLITLFFNAKGYLNLSTYEGFGLGIAQAMTAELPAFAANASCIPEIAQDGVYLIDIEKNMDYKKIANSIKKYFESEDRIKDTVKKAKKIAANYNWDKTVNQTLNEINSLTNVKD